MCYTMYQSFFKLFKAISLCKLFQRSYIFFFFKPFWLKAIWLTRFFGCAMSTSTSTSTMTRMTVACGMAWRGVGCVGGVATPAPAHQHQSTSTTSTAQWLQWLAAEAPAAPAALRAGVGWVS